MRSLSTTAPFGFDFDTARFLAAYRALGCRACQFYRNTRRAPRLPDALRLISGAGMSFDSIHGVFGPEYDPSNPDTLHRAHCLSVYEEEAKVALDLGVSAVVVHPSANRADLSPYPDSEALSLQAQRWPAFDDFARRLGDVGERIGVTFLLENVPRHSPLGHDPIELARHVLAAGSPRVRMCFDVGHAHITGDLYRAVGLCAPAIAYLHIHDNAGKTDDHLMPGDGSIDWARFAGLVRAAGLRVPCMMEVFYPEPQVEDLGRGGLGARLAAACAIGET